MRERLAALEGKRIEVFGTVERFGKKAAYKGPPLDTVLLVNLADRFGNVVTDHLWLTVRKQIKSLKLKPGDRLRFQARSKPYVKGYRGHRDDVDRPRSLDYCLSNPNHFVKMTSEPRSLQGTLFDSITQKNTQ